VAIGVSSCRAQAGKSGAGVLDDGDQLVAINHATTSLALRSGGKTG
jgi:hypothetical protein